MAKKEHANLQELPTRKQINNRGPSLNATKAAVIYSWAEAHGSWNDRCPGRSLAGAAAMIHAQCPPKIGYAKPSVKLRHW